MDYANNGRVLLKENEIVKIYPLSSTGKKSDFNEEAIKGIHNNNSISTIFFSDINMDAVQEAIRYQVYVKSCKKHIIARQSDTELKIIMRAIYLQHTKHRDYDVLTEIKRLNGLVLDYCVPRILQEINMYFTYKKDLERLPIPLDRGEFQSAKGTKFLEQKNF